MKARVKATGKIIEVEEYHKYLETGWKYRDNAGTLYKPSALYFSDEAVIDYWTRLEHQYAGMAMQGIISNEDYLQSFSEDARGDLFEDIARVAADIAHALVEKYKKEE